MNMENLYHPESAPSRWQRRAASRPRPGRRQFEWLTEKLQRGWMMAPLAGTLFALGCQPQAAPPAGPPPASVVVAEAQVQPVAEKLSLIGSLAANEMIEVKAEVEGVVQEVLFKEGERVHEGDLLVRLDASKMEAAVAEAEASFKLSEANYARSRELAQDALISRQEYDQAASVFELNRASLELKRRLLKDARIVAPFAGIVGNRLISPGQVIARNSILTWLVDLDPVKLEVNVPERFLRELRIGQAVEFSVAAYPDQKFAGELYFIAPHVDPATRTALIKALIPNPDLKLKSGMFASLDLTLELRAESLVIPEAALARVFDDSRASVFVVDENGVADLRRVRLGVRLARDVEILDGLTAGERVIVEGIQRIGPGAKVQIAPAKGEQVGK